MARLISDLTAASTPPDDADLIWLEQSDAPRKLTMAELREGVRSASLAALNVSLTLDETHAGEFLYYTTTTTYTVTLPGTGDTDFPVYAKVDIIRLAASGEVTISIPSGVSLTYWDGSGTTPTGLTGVDTASVGVGGYATLHRLSVSAWHLKGFGVSG